MLFGNYFQFYNIVIDNNIIISKNFVFVLFYFIYFIYFIYVNNN